MGSLDGIIFSLHLVDMIEDHESEGEGINDIQELIGSEVAIGWQLQGGDKFVLEVTRVVEGFIETQGSAQLEEERTQVSENNEGCCLWVVFGPDFSEFLVHVTVEEPTVLGLSLFVPFQNNGYE